MDDNDLEQKVERIAEAKLRSDSESKRRKERLRERKRVEVELRKQVDDLTTEVSTLKTERRVQSHRSKFAEVASALKVRPEALDDLFALSKYAPESDDIDERAMKKAIENTLANRPHFVQGAEPEQVQQPALLPGMSVVQGKASSGYFQPTPEQLSDTVWLYRNQANLAKAYTEGTLKS